MQQQQCWNVQSTQDRSPGKQQRSHTTHAALVPVPKMTPMSVRSSSYLLSQKHILLMPHHAAPRFTALTESTAYFTRHSVHVSRCLPKVTTKRALAADGREAMSDPCATVVAATTELHDRDVNNKHSVVIWIPSIRLNTCDKHTNTP